MKKRLTSIEVNIEHLYILFLLIVVLILFGYIFMKHLQYSNNHKYSYNHKHSDNHKKQPIIIKETSINNIDNTLRPVPIPLMADVLLNPYQAPLRDDRYYPTIMGMGGIPINIPTQSVNSSYRQVGILTRGDTILPLMGKPLFTNRDKWNFYTMNDKNNMIKLPLSNKGKSCTNEFGCDNIYNGDNVYVEGYNNSFKATIYDNQVMQYIPFL
jgi:hypothetical protein